MRVNHNLLVSVIVPTYNRKDLLVNCLNCIKAQTYEHIETIVVDDGSIDGTCELVNEDFPQFKYLKGNGNLWWTGAINLGIKFAISKIERPDFVVLLNDDTEFDSDYIKILVELANKNRESLIGSVSVDIHSPNKITYGGNIINSWFSSTNYINRGMNIYDIDPDIMIECSNLIGRGIIIPVDAFDKLGLYNEKRFKHRGDTEFPVRAKKIGYKLYVSYKSIVKMYPDETYGIDIAEKYKLSDFYYKFFDFRSSSYIKYRFYYSWIQSDNFVQFVCFFISTLIANLRRFFLKLRF